MSLLAFLDASLSFHICYVGLIIQEVMANKPERKKCTQSSGKGVLFVLLGTETTKTFSTCRIYLRHIVNNQPSLSSFSVNILT